MRRVVNETKVDVGVVDGRVAALGVVADVERVIRPRRDPQAGLVGGVEHGRRDLADPAAEAGRNLAVEDHRRLEEALRRRARAGRSVEREGRAGRDQLAVDQAGDELDVVDPVWFAAVDRLVAADARRDPHRPRLGGRAPSRLVRHDHAGASLGRRERGGEHVATRRGDGDHAPRPRRDHGYAAVRRNAEAGVPRRPADAVREPLEVPVGRRAADRESGRATVRERE